MTTFAKHWLFLFFCSLLASLLACWHFSPTTAQVTIESVPPQVVEGENVLLLVHNLPENLAALVWFKGVEITDNVIGLYTLNLDLSDLGLVFSGRETVYPNGSLLIRNVTKNDTGFYTLRTLDKHADIAATTMYLLVHSKWFFVNSGFWVGFIPLDTHSIMACAFLPCVLHSSLGVWVFTSGHSWFKIMAIDQNFSFDFTLQTGGQILG